MHVLAVYHTTVTLRMMSDSEKSSAMITAHLTIIKQAEDTVLIAESLKRLVVVRQQLTCSSWSSKE
jgi:hypothetical protein